MKKIAILLISCSMTISCGVGTYSHYSGREDIARVSFTATHRYEIVVNIDGQRYNLETVKKKEHKSDRNIEQTTKNVISVAPGVHNVSVTVSGGQIFEKQLFLSANETRIIEL